MTSETDTVIAADAPSLEETEVTQVISVPEETSIPSEDQSVEEDTENARIPTIPQLCVALGMLGILFGAPYLFPLLKSSTTETTPTPLEERAAVSPDSAFPTDAFAGVTLEAEAAYVWDISLQRALYTKNAQAQLPLASLTKLMTALVTYETQENSDEVIITLDALRQEGDNGFREGDTWNTKNLLDFTLMTSSNDGAYALAGSVGRAFADATTDPETAFIQHMNKKAEEIGLTHTYFINPTGLDASEAQSGSYGSARDVAFLMEYIIRNASSILAETRHTSAKFTDMTGAVYDATNTNQHISNIPNPLGSKTGYTVLAGGNLVIGFDIGLNHPIVISVLGSTREGRFTDVEKLIARVQNAYTTAP